MRTAVISQFLLLGIYAAWCEMREGFRYFRTEWIIAAEDFEICFPQQMDRLRAERRNAMDADRKRYEEEA